MTWRDATRCAGLALRGAAWRAALAWCALPRLRGCPAWRAAPAWRGCPAWRAAPAGMIGPALHVGLAGVTGPDGAPPRPADDPETEGGLRAYIRNPEGIATTARPLPSKKIFLSP